MTATGTAAQNIATGSGAMSIADSAAGERHGGRHCARRRDADAHWLLDEDGQQSDRHGRCDQ